MDIAYNDRAVLAQGHGLSLAHFRLDSCAKLIIDRLLGIHPAVLRHLINVDQRPQIDRMDETDGKLLSRLQRIAGQLLAALPVRYDKIPTRIGCQKENGRRSHSTQCYHCGGQLSMCPKQISFCRKNYSRPISL